MAHITENVNEKMRKHPKKIIKFMFYSIIVNNFFENCAINKLF